MRKILQVLAMSALIVVSASTADAQISFGLRIGPPPAPRAYRVPRQPGPDYVWIEGYWYPQGKRYAWRNGYWTRPPYEGAYWVEPYNSQGLYFAGQWEGGRGDVSHDNGTDRGTQRDQNPARRSNGRGNRNR
jgi:hypothetical protein